MAKLEKIPTRTFTLYDGRVTIDFYEKYGNYKHVYIRRDNGEWLKSVTKAISILNKPALIPWACKMMEEKIFFILDTIGKITRPDITMAKNAHREFKDKAADKGTMAHDLISEYIKFKLKEIKKMPPMPEDDEVKNCYLAFRDWETTHKVKFVSTEKLVYSEKYNFVGTLDCVAIVDGEFCLIDFKTSNGIYHDYIYQVSGYGIAYEEELKKTFDRNWIVRFGKDTGEFEAKPFQTDAKLQKAFLSCLYLVMIEDDVKKLL